MTGPESINICKITAGLYLESEKYDNSFYIINSETFLNYLKYLFPNNLFSRLKYTLPFLIVDNLFSVWK